jgi:6,7-dimethyl-8-ribityllumazine synthase
MKDNGIVFPELDGSALKIGIVVARWNNEYTHSIRDGAINGLKACSVDANNIIVQEVPGAYEVVYGAKRLIEDHAVDAVVCVGVLIKGETMHFEYISEAVSQGIMDLNVHSGIPVVFGVLACLDDEQAKVRSIGKHNHGVEWGKSAVEMALLRK